MTTRRTILTAIGLSPLAAMPAVAAVSPEERIERAITELRDALVVRYGDDKNTIAYQLGYISTRALL